MKDQGQEAGDNSEQYQAGRDLVVVQTGITYTEAKAIALEVFEKNAPKLTAEAKRIIDDRTEHLNDQIVRRIFERNEDNLSRFGDPRLLAALVSAQRSFAETGREDLGAILTGLVSDLAAEPEPTRREIVLRLAIDCAPRLTQPHLNALSVIFLIRNRLHFIPHFDPLPAILDRAFSPYYGNIPEDAFDYSYMGSTEAGTFYGGFKNSPYKVLYSKYANVMYEPFLLSEVPDNVLAQVDGEEALLTYLRAVPEDVHKPTAADRRYRLSYEASLPILSKTQDLTHAVQHALRNFIDGRAMTFEEFKCRIGEETPKLTEFFDQIEATLALDFELSPIGIMLAKQETSNRDPEAAAQMDKLFDV